MKKFKWLYIGSGNIARGTALQVTKGNHEIVGIYSRNSRSAQTFAEKYNARVYLDIDEAIEKSGADCAYIATPHTSHVEYSVKCMEKGMPVLCEKPVGVSIKDAQALIKCAKENNVYFAEAMWTWYSEPALEVKRWIDEKAIGDIKKVKLYYSFPGFLMSKNSRVRRADTAGGSLLDVGIYPITYCYNLFGYPESIRCSGFLKDGIDYGERVSLMYKGHECKMNISLIFARESCTIYGTRGRIFIPMFHMASTAILYSKGKKKIFKGKTDYLTEFDKVADEIRQGKKESGYIPFKATGSVMEIMDECRKQMNLVYPFE